MDPVPRDLRPWDQLPALATHFGWPVNHPLLLFVLVAEVDANPSSVSVVSAHNKIPLNPQLKLLCTIPISSQVTLNSSFINKIPAILKEPELCAQPEVHVNKLN